MKLLTSILTTLCVAFALNCQAADTAPKKKKSPAKKPAAEAAKAPSKLEAIAKTLTRSQNTKLLALLNEGEDAALVAIPGVGETRAAAIKKARPFKDVTEVAKVDGVGEGTFAEMVAYAKAGFPKSEAKAEEPKGEAKKKAEPKKSKSTKKK
jgi:DNA uptake protein ComE-like DNA-binding protein